MSAKSFITPQYNQLYKELDGTKIIEKANSFQNIQDIF